MNGRRTKWGIVLTIAALLLVVPGPPVGATGPVAPKYIIITDTIMAA